jgi:hypothetical protein
MKSSFASGIFFCVKQQKNEIMLRKRALQKYHSPLSRGSIPVAVISAKAKQIFRRKRRLFEEMGFEQS